MGHPRQNRAASPPCCVLTYSALMVSFSQEMIAANRAGANEPPPMLFMLPGDRRLHSASRMACRNLAWTAPGTTICS